MMHEKDYLAPLDPDMLAAYASGNYKVAYDESNDIWALGQITRHHNSVLHFQRGF